MESHPLAAATLRLHLDYNVWATRRLLEAAAALTPAECERDFGTADKSVVGTLAHCFGAERIWLDRITGREQRGLRPEEKDRSYLAEAWPGLHAAWAGWARPLTDASLEAELDYRDLRGNAWRQPLWQIALHVVNHSTHHRGQVSGFLRALGHVPPPLDLIAFYRGLPAS